MMKLDSRQFSQKAYNTILAFRDGDETIPDRCIQLNKKHHSKAASLIQGLSTYIATWGLHHLSGDAIKFLKGTAEDTTYKGIVYQEFLYRLKELSQHEFEPTDPATLIHLPLPQYTVLNHLAIRLAEEWSFWAPAVLADKKSAEEATP